MQGVYSPSKIDGGQVLEYENGLAATTSNILSNFNSSLQAYQPAAAAGALKTLDSAQWVQLNTSVAAAADSAAAITAVNSDTAVMPGRVLSVLQSALGLVQDNSVLTLGQNTVFPGAMVCNGNITESVVQGVREACVSPQLTAVP